MKWSNRRKELDSIYNPSRTVKIIRLFGIIEIVTDTQYYPQSKERQIISVRILYPKGKDDESLLLSDSLAELIAVCLKQVKSEREDKIIVSDVRIDRHGDSREERISQDIFDANCFVIIVLTEDVKQMSKHPTFEHELEQVLYAINKKRKPEKMFLPVYTCCREEMESKSETIKQIFKLITAGEAIVTSSILDANWVENKIYKKHISKL
jgi:hypothetical protein